MLLAVVLLLGAAAPGGASERVFDEYQVKAVFLYRLALFVTWPDIGPDTADNPFIFGIVGGDPFGQHIDRVVQNETFKGRPVRIQRYPSLEALEGASPHVLFVSQSLKQKWPKLRNGIARHSILTVSDLDAFCEMGGMVNIKTPSDKIKIEINPGETQSVGLKISSKLLKISRQVATAPEGGRQ